jgi:hypothetical protein
MVSQCPLFTGDPDGNMDAVGGDRRHKALAKLLSANDPLLLQDLPDEDKESIEWAADYIKLKADMASYPLIVEQKRKWLRPDFSEATGTPDVICGSDLFDLKTRRRDYTAQMADYSLSMFHENPGLEVVHVHLLYTAAQGVMRFDFTREDAEEVVQRALDKAKGTEPKPCDYCGWCALAYKCPALLKPADEVSKGYTADPRVQSWHPSQMQTGEELAYALWVWRTQLKKWGESIEHHAREAALKGGMTLACKVAEWTLKSKAGRTYVTDIPQAFTLAGLPQEDFLRCCDLRMETSKTYKDKHGIANKYAGLHGMKLAPAKRELLKKLEPVVKTTPETLSLVAVRAEATEDESE